METFISYPLAAFLVSGIFAVLCAFYRKVAPGVAAALWAGYAYYEYLMHIRVLCTGECDIRIDLLLIYPVLLVASMWAVISSIRRGKK